MDTTDVTTEAKNAPPIAPAVNTPVFRFRGRDWFALAGGLLIYWFISGGPRIDSLWGVDLRFGLSGPIASVPWHWFAALVVLLWVRFAEGRPLSSLLFVRMTRDDWTWLAWGCGAALIVGVPLAFAGVTTGQGVDLIIGLGVPGVLLMIVTAAVTEEIIYRGYLAERLGALARSRWVGAIVSFVLFVIPHVTVFGWSWFLGPAAGAFAIAATALFRRNLWAAIIIHAAVNAPTLILAALHA